MRELSWPVAAQMNPYGLAIGYPQQHLHGMPSSNNSSSNSRSSISSTILIILSRCCSGDSPRPAPSRYRTTILSSCLLPRLPGTRSHAYKAEAD